jgi:hypothetical protein
MIFGKWLNHNHHFRKLTTVRMMQNQDAAFQRPSVGLAALGVSAKYATRNPASMPPMCA